MFESLTNNFDAIIAASMDFAILLGVLVVARLFYGLTTGMHLKNELVVRDNAAAGIGLSGYAIGVAIAASGALVSIGQSDSKPLMLAAAGIVAIILTRISIFINDKFILSKFHNLTEIIDHKNSGIALVEAGSCIASGLMIYGVMSGPAESAWDKLAFGSLYWAIGQAILVIGSKVYRPLCGFDLDYELQHDNNVSAGLSLSGFLIGLGLIVQAGFYGASTNVGDEISTAIAFTVAGLVLLWVSHLVLDKTMIGGGSAREIARDGSIGAGAVCAMAFVCVGILFSSATAPFTDGTINAAGHKPVKVVVVNDSQDNSNATEAEDKK